MSTTPAAPAAPAAPDDDGYKNLSKALKEAGREGLTVQNVIAAIAKDGKTIANQFSDVATNVAASGKAFKELNRTMRDSVISSNMYLINTLETREALSQLKGRRAEVLKLAQQESVAGKYANQMLESELDLLRTQATVYGYKGDLAEYVTAQLKEGKSIQDIRTSSEFESLDAYQKTIEFREKEQALQIAIKNRADTILDQHDALKNSLKQEIGFMREMASNPKLQLAVVAAGAAKAIKGASESMDEFKKQGLSAGQAVQATFKGMSVMSILGLSDVKGVTNGMIAAYGNVNALSGEVVDSLGQMSRHFGITGEEALKTNEALSQMPGETSKSAAHAMEMTGHLAEMQGINPGKIMKDMSTNTGAMALFGSKGAEAFGKSVIALHKMGVEVATAAAMAKGLLNFEDSINAQMEASVLLGREINLDKAREMALNHDIEGATKEILKNVGSQEEYNKLNVLQQEALAKSAGMTVEQLQKAMDAQVESNKYYGEGASSAMNLLGHTKEIASATIGFAKENGMLLIAGIQLLTNQNAMKMISNGLLIAKNVLVGIGNGLLMAGSFIMNLITGGIFKQIAGFVTRNAIVVAGHAKDYAHAAWQWATEGTMFGLWMANMGKKRAARLAEMTLDKTKAAADRAAQVASGAASNVSGLAKTAVPNPAAGLGIATFLKGLAMGLSSFASGKVLMGAVVLAASMVLFGLGIAGFAKALSLIPITDLLVAAVALPIFALGFKLMTSIVGKIDLGSVAKGALALALIGAALIPAALAFSLLQGVDPKTLIGFSIALPLLGLAAAGLGFLIVPIALGALALASLGVGMIAVSAGLLALQAAQGGIAVFESLTAIAANVGGLGGVAMAMMGIAGGLGLMAYAGLAAMPIIGMLIALATVAPALVGLGAALGGMFGGGGGEKEDKMDTLIAEIRALKAIASAGGVVNMDGKKVGEVIRRAIPTLLKM